MITDAGVPLIEFNFDFDTGVLKLGQVVVKE